MKFSQSVLKLHISEELKKKREEAKENGVPVADEETLAYLLYTVKTIRPKRILNGSEKADLRRMQESSPVLGSYACQADRRHHALWGALLPGREETPPFWTR